MRELLKAGFVSANVLEKNSGGLIHVIPVLPFVYHFSQQMHELQLQRRAMNRRQIKVTDIHDEDLKLMLFFL